MYRVRCGILGIAAVIIAHAPALPLLYLRCSCAFVPFVLIQVSTAKGKRRPCVHWMGHAQVTQICRYYIPFVDTTVGAVNCTLYCRYEARLPMPTTAEQVCAFARTFVTLHAYANNHQVALRAARVRLLWRMSIPTMPASAHLLQKRRSTAALCVAVS